MNKNKACLNKNSLSLMIAIVVLLVVGLACGSKTPPPSAYVGTWTGSDSTLIVIRADGSADYKSGNSSVTNGSVTVDEGAKSLKIGFAGMGPSYTIDKSPSGDQMTLSGVVFRKGGGSGTSSSTTSSGPDSSSSSKDHGSDDH